MSTLASKLAPVRRPPAQNRLMISADDTGFTKQIVSTHAPDTGDLDVRPVLSIAEDILRFAWPLADENKGINYDTETPQVQELLGDPIIKISNEITSKLANGGEPHKVTIDILKSLSTYSWEAKAVIAFAGFAIIYGELWLVLQHFSNNPFANNIATLKNLPKTIAQSSVHLRNQWNYVFGLMNTIRRVTHCIVEFKELPRIYISAESPQMIAVATHIPHAIYWSIRGFLLSASTLFNLIGGSDEYITKASVSWELASFTHKLSNIAEHLQTQLKTCTEIVEKKKAEDAYTNIKRLLESEETDNIKVLNAFFRPKEDKKPLYNGSRRTKEMLEVLRGKYVLLLITNLELSGDELFTLRLLYKDTSTRNEYEIVWFPVVEFPVEDQKNTMQDETFFNLQKNMPWYSAEQPSAVEPFAIKYIRDDLCFIYMPMLVVFDPNGKLCNHDALPMFYIWGTEAFPFTRDRERQLWDKTEWNIDLILDGIDPRTTEWMSTEKVICLYGGEDVEWIRRITHSSRSVAQALSVPLEMLYVGTRSPKRIVRFLIEVITNGNLSHVFANDYSDYAWYFWMRISSMWNSMKQIGRKVEDDKIMQGIRELLTYDSGEQGWAMFSRGNSEITMANREKMLHVLDDFNNWVYEVDRLDKFFPVLDKELRGYHPKHHCHRLILPGKEGDVPERLLCSECGKTMGKFFMYKCCVDG